MTNPEQERTVEEKEWAAVETAARKEAQQEALRYHGEWRAALDTIAALESRLALADAVVEAGRLVLPPKGTIFTAQQAGKWAAIRAAYETYDNEGVCNPFARC